MIPDSTEMADDAHGPAPRTSLPPRVVLTGFMGTGKSTAGRHLAARLRFDFIDTDHHIELTHGPIAEIFSQRGEHVFRQIERDVALELGSRTRVVIATGGGMLLDPVNVSAFGDDSVIFWLDASVEEILHRVSSGRQRRPLLEARDQRAAIEELLAERTPAYSRFERIDTNGRSAYEVAALLASRTALAARRTGQE